jgi:hypothetical protein
MLAEPKLSIIIELWWWQCQHWISEIAEVNDGGSVKKAFDFALGKLGYEKLRLEQDKFLWTFVSGRDVFAALPTGYAKSLCFALLPVVFDRLRGKSSSIVICVSPLTSDAGPEKEILSS